MKAGSSIRALAQLAFLGHLGAPGAPAEDGGRKKSRLKLRAPMTDRQAANRKRRRKLQRQAKKANRNG